MASDSALVVFVLYTLLVFGLAAAARRILASRSFLSEYFLGSRDLGVLALALTFGATSASAGSFAGFPSLIYAHGWSLALWIASYMIFPLCGIGLLGKRLNHVARISGAITLPDVLRARFESRAVAILSTLILAVLLTVYLIPQFTLAGLIVERLLADTPIFHDLAAVVQRDATWLVPPGVGAQYVTGLVLFGGLVVVYTTIGGFRAVVWTDMLQGLVMLVGVVVLLVLALTHVGGLSRATQALSEMTPPRLGEIEFVLPEPADATIAIPTDTWLWIRADGESEDRLVRTNQAALVPVGSDISNRVRATEITGAKEIERVASMPGFAVGTPEGAVPRIIASREYAFGAGRRGVYVTAPGPSAEDATGFLPIGLAFSFFVYWALSGTGQPGNLVRLMAFKDSVTMKRGIAALAVFFSMIYFPLVIIFCCARLIVPGLDHTPDRIMPVLSYELTSSAGIPWMAGLLIAAPFAAAMSTVDSFMLIISSAFVRDIYQREFRPHASERTVKGMSYACTVLVGAVALIGSLDPPRFLQYVVVFAGGALSVAFLAPVALGLYWERFNRAGALSAVCGGVLVYLGLYFAGFVKYGGAIPVRPLGLDPLIWGFAASLAGAWAGVRWGLPVSPEIRRRFFS